MQRVSPPTAATASVILPIPVRSGAVRGYTAAMRGGSPPPGGTARVCPLFIGREDAMAFALRRRDQAASGAGGMLLFGGEAGIGKSRLLDEVTDAAGGRIVRAEVFADDRDNPGLLALGIAAWVSAEHRAADPTGHPADHDRVHA